jgi:hypothetical protein
MIFLVLEISMGRATCHHGVSLSLLILKMTATTPSDSRYWLRDFFIYIVLSSMFLQSRVECDAFVIFRRCPLNLRCNNILGGGFNNGGGRKTPRNSSNLFNDDGDDDARIGISAMKLAGLYRVSADSDETHGNRDTSREDKGISKDNFQVSSEINFDPIRTGKTTPEKARIENKKSMGKFFNDSLTILVSPFRIATSALINSLPAIPFQGNVNGQSSKSKMREQQKVLSSTVVRSVSAPGSELLPSDDITKCAKESNLIGGALTPESLELTADKINRLYLEHGYVMNCVTGATLVPSSEGNANDGEGHVELKVREVKLAKPSQRNSSLLHIRFVEKLSCDDAGDKENVISLPLPSSSDRSQGDQPTYRIVSGRTRPSKIARMLNLVPGSHFCVLPEVWSRLVASPGSVAGVGKGKLQQHPIFSAIHALRPLPTAQDSVELEIVATENKPYVSLEYGVTKSLYSDRWEGELDLKHDNAFGGGEVATMNIRKGKNRLRRKNVFSSGPINWRMTIKDDYLGSSNAGYDIEVFRDHVDVSEQNEVDIGDVDCPLRTGITTKVRFPQSSYSFAIPKAVSARFECVDPFTQNDCTQFITSMSADFGDQRTLKLSKRPVISTVTATATTGRKWSSVGKRENVDDSSSLPYATGTITSQQIMSLESVKGTTPLIDLAIRHVASTSSRHLPRHEAMILGLSSRIRGYKYNYQQSPMQNPQKETKHDKSLFQSLKKIVQGQGNEHFRPPITLSNAISGTVEIRIPFERLIPSSTIGSGNVILFGDWCVSQTQPLHSLMQSPGLGGLSVESSRHSSLGIGLRKAVQGIPLKVDACITEHGTKGLFFGIGHN